MRPCFYLVPAWKQNGSDCAPVRSQEEDQRVAYFNVEQI